MDNQEEGGSRIQSGMTGDQPSPEASADKGRIQANRHRELQVARGGARKLFDVAAKSVFLEWFAATCNLSWAAEMAGFNYKTVLRHRMNDADFAADFDRAMAQGYARLEAKRLETKRQPLRIGIEGDWDAPETADMPDERIDAILRERGRQLAGPSTGSGQARRQGRPPRVASNAEVREALTRRLRAFRDRIRARGRSSDADKSLLPLDGGGRVGVDSATVAVPADTLTPTLPLEPQVRPPDEPKSDSNPIEGEGK